MDKPIGAELASRLSHLRDQSCPEQPMSPPISRQNSRDYKHSTSIDPSFPFRRLDMLAQARSPWNRQPATFTSPVYTTTPTGVLTQVKPQQLVDSTKSAHSFHPSGAFADEASVNSSSMPAFFQRFHDLQLTDKRKEALILDLFARIQSLESQAQQPAQKSSKDEEPRRDSFKKSNRFIPVLIDGTCMPFDQEFYLAGFGGGERAAKALHDAVQQAVDCILSPKFSNKLSLIIRIYEDMSSFDDDVPITEFARGFNGVFDSVEMIDGGAATSRKVAQSLKHHLSMSQGLQVLFGGAHNSKHAETLKDIIALDPSLEKHVCLIATEHSNIESSFRPLGIHTLYNPFDATGSSERCRRQVSTTNGSDWLTESSGSPPSSTSSWTTSTASREESPPFQKNPVLDPVAEPYVATTAVTTYASTVANAKSDNSSSPICPKKSATTIYVQGDPNISRNKHGERLDPFVPHCKESVDRIKRKKLCNVHFLRQECSYGARCTHVHDYNPTKDELKILALVARMAPCLQGGKCDDPKCIYGHICPQQQGNKHGQLCVFGDKCKFPAQMHNVDRTAVAVMQIGGH